MPRQTQSRPRRGRRCPCGRSARRCRRCPRGGRRCWRARGTRSRRAPALMLLPTARTRHQGTRWGPAAAGASRPCPQRQTAARLSRGSARPQGQAGAPRQPRRREVVWPRRQRRLACAPMRQGTPSVQCLSALAPLRLRPRPQQPLRQSLGARPGWAPLVRSRLPPRVRPVLLPQQQLRSLAAPLSPPLGREGPGRSRAPRASRGRRSRALRARARRVGNRASLARGRSARQQRPEEA